MPKVLVSVQIILPGKTVSIPWMDAEELGGQSPKFLLVLSSKALERYLQKYLSLTFKT